MPYSACLERFDHSSNVTLFACRAVCNVTPVISCSHIVSILISFNMFRLYHIGGLEHFLCVYAVPVGFTHFFV
jgi:hypothetical protein